MLFGIKLMDFILNDGYLIQLVDLKRILKIRFQ